jgi:hypothetical protein
VDIIRNDDINTSECNKFIGTLQDPQNIKSKPRGVHSIIKKDNLKL